MMLTRCICQMVPNHVLKRLSRDRTLPPEQRKKFTDTMKIDAELRQLRNQASKVTRVAHAIAPAAARKAAAVPAITVFNCNNTPGLPGVHMAAGSPDRIGKRVLTATTSVAKFYSQVFGRNSVDGAGMTLISSIHFGVGYNNAVWNGTQMIYGDGDGSIFIDFSKANDVIGHELTHGVTQHSLALLHVDEAGGLNESLSDCFGSMFRQWEAKETVDQADWLLGKDVMGPAAIKKGYKCMRDMANPAAKHCMSPQPVKFSQYKDGMDQHVSSGIPNHAFYTVAKAVGGHSWEKVGQIWYKAMTGFGQSPAMKMKAFADRTRAVAAQLFPGDVADAVNAGWKKVGL
jgi:Zn-dependent metalloprotease